MPGILKHKLGHILGFRHEHIRVAKFAAQEPSQNLYPVTPYDPRSIMHYYLPPYGGSKEGHLSISDVEGALYYYGPPLYKFKEFDI